MAETDKSEKITINIGLVDLGHIDLLVDEGFYANRTDFIRTAIRRQLETRAAAVDDTVARRTLTLGTQHLSRRDLEDLRNAGASGGEVQVVGTGAGRLGAAEVPDLAPGCSSRLGRAHPCPGPADGAKLLEQTAQGVGQACAGLRRPGTPELVEQAAGARRTAPPG